MTSVAVQYDEGSSGLYLPDLGIEVQRGVPVEVPVEVAGHAPGEWRARVDGDPEHWPTRIGEDGSTVETHDPGSGLLAQVGLWRLADAPAPAPAANDDDLQEG